MKILSNKNIIILKYETIKILRKALCYKWERIILLLMIPELISQLILCEGSFKILSLFALTPLFLACFYGVGEMRKEGIQELRGGMLCLLKDKRLVVLLALTNSITDPIIQANEQKCSAKNTIIRLFYQDNFISNYKILATKRQFVCCIITKLWLKIYREDLKNDFKNGKA